MRSEGAEGEQSSGRVKKAFGVVLLAGGLSLAVWTFSHVISLLAGGDVGLIERLIPISRTSRSILIEGQNVELPESFFEYGAYGMAVGLLSVVATMANAMVRGGAALLRSDLLRLADQSVASLRR